MKTIIISTNYRAEFINKKGQLPFLTLNNNHITLTTFVGADALIVWHALTCINRNLNIATSMVALSLFAAACIIILTA